MPAPLIIKPGQLEKDPDLHHEFLFKGSPHWQIKLRKLKQLIWRGSEMKYIHEYVHVIIKIGEFLVSIDT